MFATARHASALAPNVLFVPNMTMAVLNTAYAAVVVHNYRVASAR